MDLNAGQLADAHALVEAHLHLVTTIARHHGRRAYPRLDMNDLKGAGAVGLVEASRRFNPELGIPFGAFARRRIEGAILEFMRTSDPLTRTQRRHVKDGTRADVQMLSIDASDMPLAVHDDRPSAEVDTIRARERALLLEMIRALPKRHRKVILQRYYKDAPMNGLCGSLRCGHSRISQIHAEAITRLRRQLSRRGVTAESLTH